MANSAHGGFDGGAEGEDGTLEKDINYSIVCKTAALLRFGGFNVVLTRTGDQSVESDPSDTISRRKVSDMKNRLQIMNSYKESIFISIHQNKFTTSKVSGAQVFYSPNNEESQQIADNVQNSLKKYLEQSNERSIKKADKTIYLMKNAKIPAIIVECGFLSNKEELSRLKTDDYQRKIAFAVYCGILDYYS